MGKEIKLNDIEFHHELAVQLRYTDADMQGHVNNTIYFQYFNMAYINYLDTLSLTIDTHSGIVVAHVDCDFISPVHIGDNVTVQTAVTFIGNKSFTIESRLVDTNSDEVRAKATYIMCSFDLDNQRSMKVPDTWIDAMEKYEQRRLRA